MAPTQEFYEGYRASEFVLEVGGIKSPGVSKVSGLSEGELDTVEQPDGATGHVYKVSGAKVKYEPLTIERRVDGSPQDKQFLDWFTQTFRPKELTPSGSTVRRSGLITKYHFGTPVLMFSFKDAWVKSSKFSDLEAGSTNLLIQTIVLEHEGLEREAIT
jgi:phage tail-like protein